MKEAVTNKSEYGTVYNSLLTTVKHWMLQILLAQQQQRIVDSYSGYILQKQWMRSQMLCYLCVIIINHSVGHDRHPHDHPNFRSLPARLTAGAFSLFYFFLFELVQATYYIYSCSSSILSSFPFSHSTLLIVLFLSAACY